MGKKNLLGSAILGSSSAKAIRLAFADSGRGREPRRRQISAKVVRNAEPLRSSTQPKRRSAKTARRLVGNPPSSRKGNVDWQHLAREPVSASQALSAELVADATSASSAKPARRGIVRTSKRKASEPATDARPAKPWKSRWKSAMRGEAAAAAACAEKDFDLADGVVRELLAPVFKGGSSIAQSQRIASAVSRSGGASSSTSLLASVGSRGAFPNNAERDLHRLAAKSMIVKPKVSWVHLTVVDVRSMKHLLAAKKPKKRKKLTRNDKKLAQVVGKQKFPVRETRI